MAAQATTPTRLALGVVTYNSPLVQLQRLVRSIGMAADRLAPLGCDAALVSIDCGDPADWSAVPIPHRRLSPQGNLGFGGGMNRLMAEAFADARVGWFLCVNPDGVPHRDLLAELLRFAARYPESLIEARQFPEEYPKSYDPVSGLTLWASGACLLIPRRIWSAIGGFDDNIFMFMEDVDYSWRARGAGFTVRVAPRALFGHSVLDRAPDLRIEAWYYQSARYLAYKWRRPAEQAGFERVILERGFAAALPPLPPLERPNSRPPADTAPAMFEHGFTYAPIRWGG